MMIDGKQVAGEILEKLKSRPKPEKFLGAVLVGSDPASVSFLKQKQKTAEELGVDFRLYTFREDVTGDDLRREVGRLANQKTCGGLVVQLPLPEGVNQQYVMNPIPREKDVDVLGERALGAFYTGRNPALPPSVGVTEEILARTNFDLEKASVAVIGMGMLVGRPIALWCMRKVRKLTFLHRGDDHEALRGADLVISGAGEAGILKPEVLKEGVAVIDFGCSTADGKLRGDLDASGPGLEKLRFYTPTPGGTGPILVAKLFENFYTLNSL